MQPLNYRNSFRSFPLGYAFLTLFLLSSIAQASSIEGFVYDQNRNPIQDIDVELRNENGQTRQRTRTNGIGRYAFRNLADGRYYVKVFAFRYNLVDQEEMVRIDSLSILGGLGNETYQQDFYLVSKTGGLGDTTTGVVFAQEVPKAARDSYEQGIKLMGKDERDAGFRKLIEAVQTFPTYYEALNRLGMHLLYKERFLDAASMFVRAVEVNPKSSKSFYYMGIAFSNLGEEYFKAALVAFGKAEVLAPAAHQIPLEIGKIHKDLGNFTDHQIPLEIGKIHKDLGNFTEAELNLLRAKKLAPEKRPEIHLQLAQLYGNDLKQFGKAADELELYLKASKRKDEKIEKQIENLREKARKQS